MQRVLAEDVLVRGFVVAVRGWADGFGDVFACETGACGRVAGVEDDRGDLIYVDVLVIGLGAVGGVQ